MLAHTTTGGAARGGAACTCPPPCRGDARAGPAARSSHVRPLLPCPRPHSPLLCRYPQDLRAAIDEVNEWVYRDINNGVYRCGFATSQAAYDEGELALVAVLLPAAARSTSHPAAAPVLPLPAPLPAPCVAPAAFDALFAALERCEGILGRQRYLVGDRLTEADIRLFHTLIRFDEVYVVYFKTNKVGGLAACSIQCTPVHAPVPAP